MKAFRSANPSERVMFQLATGNVGVMAATNKVVVAAELPMMVGLYAAIIGLCLVSFRWDRLGAAGRRLTR